MFQTLPTASQSVEQLFTDTNCFSVPIYQRPYSWSKEGAARLLDDVSTAAGIGEDQELESDYFLGAILLLDPPLAPGEPKQAASANRNLEIVDGQQRLLTITILAAVLRDLEADANSTTARRLDSVVRTSSARSPGLSSRIVLSGEDHEFFAEYVQQPGSTLHPVAAVEALSTGQRAILAAREHMRSELDDFTPDQRAALADYLCAKCHFVMIVTTDIDRAHRIFIVLNGRGSPLLTKDILKAEILKDVLPPDRESALAVWNEVESALGAEMETFFSQLRTVYGYGNQPIIAGVRKLVEDCGSSEAFIEKVFKPLGLAYALTLRAKDPESDVPDELRRPLVSLQRLNGREWVPIVLLVLTKVSDVNLARAYLNEVERAAFLMRFLNLGARKRQARLNKAVQAFASGKLPDPTEIYTPTREELRTAGYNLRDLHARNLQVCKSLLLRLNDELQPDAINVSPSAFTVEHVLPQRPKAKSQWRDWFPDSEDRLAMTASLGNLILVSEGLNDRARNDEYDRKKEIYASAQTRPGQLELTAEALKSDTWRRETIQQREAELIGRINKLWRLELEPALASEPVS